jgi:hypothetical protein
MRAVTDSARLCAVFAVLWTAGCASPDGRAPASSAGDIHQLHLIVTAVAVNFDDTPGPDGFGARVYASTPKSALAPPITRGALELLLFDGVVAAEELASRPPLRQWSYPARELKPFLQKTAVGAGYVFTPRWGDARPAKEQITVAARYVSPEGRKVYAAPGTISVPVK